MEFIHVTIIAIIQGLTEFLPISSSAHLILLPILGGWRDQGLAADVAVHLGSLFAVIAYFRYELIGMIRDWTGWLFGKGHTHYTQLANFLIVATIPVGLAGLMFNGIISEIMRSPIVIAISSIVFGILLGFSDRDGDKMREERSMNWRDVIVIGLAQALALIPGASRSGITMTAARFMHLSRETSARFSFLMSIPVILLANGLEGYKIMKGAQTLHYPELLWGVFVSAVVAFISIHFFIKLIERIGMMPFVIYRVVLGVVLLALFL